MAVNLRTPKVSPKSALKLFVYMWQILLGSVNGFGEGSTYSKLSGLGAFICALEGGLEAKKPQKRLLERLCGGCFAVSCCKFFNEC